MEIERGRINTIQFTILVILLNLGGNILVLPSTLAGTAKQDSWMAVIIGIGSGLLLVWLYNTLGEMFPDMNLVEYNEKIFGKWIGILLSLFYILVFFVAAAGTIRNVVDFLTTQILPETPIQFTAAIFVGVIIMAVRLRIETFSRTAEIFFPWIIVLFLILFLFDIPHLKLENVQPVLENGFKPVLLGVYYFLGFPFLQNVVLLMLFPYVNSIKGATKSFYLGTGVGGGLLGGISIYCILVFGASITSRLLYPSYALARQINVGNFIQRIEAIVAGIWMFSVFFKSTILLYATCLGLAQIMGLKDYRILTLPLGIILISASILYGPNTVYIGNFNKDTFPPLVLTTGFFLSLLSLIVAKLKN